MSLTLWTNNIAMPENRTFQMPITASDPDGQPLHFAATVSNKKVTAVFAPNSNRSLLINVSGVDATNGVFTGNLVLQLFEDLTPLTTARIVDLVNTNFYDGLIFHRVIQDFVAQGGDPTGTGTGGSGVTFDDEFVSSLIYDGFGQLGMANSGHDSNDSQFFITDVDLSINNANKPSPQWLNFSNPIFGQLTSGFEVLAEIMTTPVDSNDKPLSNCVMNSVTVITNSQDAVLRLTAAPKFLGTVTVTVSAANAENGSVTQALLQVNVITDTNTSPLFLGPIPSNITVTQNVAATFVVTSTDIDGLPTHIAWADIDTYPNLTNMLVTYNSKTKLISFSPNLTLTGAVNMIIGATDNIHSYDTQHFTLTFLPWSATPTMTVVPLKGSMQDSGKPLGDRISVSGTFSFNGGSDQTFGSNDVLELTLGDPGSPLNLEIVPNNGETRLSKGVYSGKARGVISGFSSNITVSAQISIPKGTFKISASNFNFPVPLTNQMLQVGIALGNDYGSDTRTWVQKKPGTFVPPAP
ncbi:MAG: peptidylprolyl isomerase [Verrucomicrobiia bacterium]